MTSTHPKPFADDPALRAIAPLILAAWDDAFLSPTELLEVRAAIEAAISLADTRAELLRRWMDPAAPPSADQLRELARAAAGTARDAELTPGLRELRRLFGLPIAPLATREPGTPPTIMTEAQIERLRVALDGAERSTRDAVRALLVEHPAFREPRPDDTHAYRERVLEQCRALSRLAVLQAQAARDVSEFSAAFETIALFDLSLVVKFGVQFGLFANAIQSLGTAQHHARLPAIRRCELLGCFAMTERAHGSNVRGLQTTAEYDPHTREFVIHTPSLAAGKEWIGGAALHAREAVVFAQLRTNGEDYGLHAFLVPVRAADGGALPGVRIEDCGHKMGLNGVDNGRIWFEHVRVPRAALLDRFGQVGEDGRYHSPIPSPSKRFFTMLGTLVGGRVNICGAGVAATKVGLTIALRYASLRTQFPDASGHEQPLLQYNTHRTRLLPALAYAYAFSFAQHALVARLAKAHSDDSAGARATEALAAGLKAVGTWRAIDTLQKCRECCGGQGYLTTNRLDALRTDADVFTTFEGDNTVLCQQLAKELLRGELALRSESPLRSLAAGLFSGADPVSARRTDDDALLDPEFHAAALHYRERTLLASLAQRVQRRVEDGADAQSAFEACQDHAVALAHARTECFVLEHFQAAARAEPLLSSLCELFALSCIIDDLAFFLAHGFVAERKARALRRAQRELCDRVAPLALSYADAFAIPALCLGPLADPDYLKRSGLAP
jgi:acyl-CoA oxidase